MSLIAKIIQISHKSRVNLSLLRACTWLTLAKMAYSFFYITKFARVSIYLSTIGSQTTRTTVISFYRRHNGSRVRPAVTVSPRFSPQGLIVNFEI